MCYINLEKCGYVCAFARGRVNATLKKKYTEQDFAISRQHGYAISKKSDMFLRKTTEIIVFCRIN